MAGVDVGALAQAAVDMAKLYYDIAKDGINVIWNVTGMAHKPYSHMINFELDSDGVWQSGTLQDGDQIRIIRRPKATAVTKSVKITLKQPSNTWWKALTVHTRDNKFKYEIVFNQDSVHENSNNVEYREILENFIVLSKAKAFGVHTNMYWIQNSYVMTPDYEWEIIWQKD